MLQRRWPCRMRPAEAHECVTLYGGWDVVVDRAFRHEYRERNTTYSDTQTRNDTLMD